jgi:hypothetical protein
VKSEKNISPSLNPSTMKGTMALKGGKRKRVNYKDTMLIIS